MEAPVNHIFDEDLAFIDKALEVFAFQYRHNAIYRRFCESLGAAPGSVTSDTDIPLIPIEAFKDAPMITWEKPQEHELLFQSSGTSGMNPSRHYVKKADLYRLSIMMGFNHFYDLDNLVIWAYLPGYDQNPYSSLIWMMKEIIKQDNEGLCAFLKPDRPLKQHNIETLQESGKQLMLFGAAFGLMDLAETNPTALPADTLIVETGGMKTHRRTMTRRTMHQTLSQAFEVPLRNIHSEYGMAEMLSQAYAVESDWFEPVPWLRISIRRMENPMQEAEPGERGLIGIMDLANVYSCSFFLTGDEGTARPDGSFMVHGRWRKAELRGCNFLIDQE